MVVATDFSPLIQGKILRVKAAPSPSEEPGQASQSASAGEPGQRRHPMSPGGPGQNKGKAYRPPLAEEVSEPDYPLLADNLVLAAVG